MQVAQHITNVIGRNTTGELFCKAELASQDDVFTFDHAVKSFGHLIERNTTVKANEFADLIAQNYSVEAPQTAEVVRLLRTLS